MKAIANTVLILLICALGYMIYNSIKEPIAFQDVKNKRKDVVAAKLDQIRNAQEIYKAVKGSYAGSFEELTRVLKNDSIPFVKIIGDPDDPENADKFTKEITYAPAIDSVKAMGINLDSLQFVPFAPAGTVFNIQADTIEYQSTEVFVVEVGTRWKEFMGEYGDARFSKYDKSYDPMKMIKFGDMNSPSISGNWE